MLRYLTIELIKSQEYLQEYRKNLNLGYFENMEKLDEENDSLIEQET